MCIRDSYPNRPINVALVTPFEINGGLAPSMQHSNSPCLMNGCSLCCRDTKMPLTNAEAIKIAPRLSRGTIIVVDSCGDALKDMKIIKERLGRRL